MLYPGASYIEKVSYATKHYLNILTNGYTFGMAFET